MSKAILVIDLDDDISRYHADIYKEDDKGNGEIVKSYCPLKHPLKHASSDFYIYDTKYLMDNLDREINLLKGTKAFIEFMEKQNESNISY